MFVICWCYVILHALRVVCLVDCWYWCSGVNSVVHVIFGLAFSFGSCRLSVLVVGCGLDFVTWYCRILAAALLWRFR